MTFKLEQICNWTTICQILSNRRCFAF